MKRKIGTVVEEELFGEAKARAAREHRALSDLFEEALMHFLHKEGTREDAMRSCLQFCSHDSHLDLDELNELMDEDILAL